MVEAPKIVGTRAQAAAVIHVQIPRAEIQQAMEPAIQLRAPIRRRFAAADNRLICSSRRKAAL